MGKYIIEIDEDDYKQLKDCPSVWNSHYERIIANGRPISTDGDLISRSDLKEQFIEGAYTSKGVREKIDSAPAINAYTPEQVKELIDLNKKLSEERPQGKWVIDEEWVTPTDNPSDDYETTTYTCPFCGRVEYTNFDYCRCGADMRSTEEVTNG